MEGLSFLMIIFECLLKNKSLTEAPRLPHRVLMHEACVEPGEFLLCRMNQIRAHRLGKPCARIRNPRERFTKLFPWIYTSRMWNHTIRLAPACYYTHHPTFFSQKLTGELPRI